MKKRIALFLVFALSLVLLFTSCAPAYEGDARVGSYIAYGADGKTVAYRLVLEADGTGEMIHYPAIGPEEKEDIIFELTDDVIHVHGTAVSGGVIGRNELSGKPVLEGDAYTFELRSGTSGTALANFVME